MPGLVEIFRVDDEGYYKAFVDGKSASVLYKGSMADCVMRREWRRAQVKKSGAKNENALRFTHYDLVRSQEKTRRETDEFDNYALCKATVESEGILPVFSHWTLDEFERSKWS